MPKIDVADYAQLYRATRGMKPEIRRDFRKRLRKAAKIGADAAKIKIRAMPSTKKYSALGAGRHFTKSKPHAGLRSTLARNIRVTVTPKEVAIRQFSEGLYGRNAQDLPKDIDSPKGGWTHPTFNHEPEVFQHGWPYFKSTMREKRRAMEKEVQQVLDDIKAKVIVGKLHLG
jgi:hypothetical protein